MPGTRSIITPLIIVSCEDAMPKYLTAMPDIMVAIKVESRTRAIILSFLLNRISIAEIIAPMSRETSASLIPPPKSRVKVPAAIPEMASIVPLEYSGFFFSSWSRLSNSESSGLSLHISRDRALSLSSLPRLFEVCLTLRSWDE